MFSLISRVSVLADPLALAAPPALSWTELRAPVPTIALFPGAAASSLWTMPTPQMPPTRANLLEFPDRSTMMSTATSPLSVRLPSCWTRLPGRIPLQLESAGSVVTVPSGKRNTLSTSGHTAAPGVNG